MHWSRCIFFIILYLGHSGVFAQTFEQKQKVLSPERAFLDRFGSAAVIDGNYALLNSSGNFTNAAYKDSIPGAGAVFCYKYDGIQWNWHQKIVEGNRTAGSSFGSDVKLSNRTAAISSRNKIHILTLNAQDSWVFEETIGIDSLFKNCFIEDFTLNGSNHLTVAVHNVFRNNISILSVFEPDLIQPDTWKISLQDSVKNILKAGNNSYGHSAVLASTANQIAYKIPGDSFDGYGFKLAIHIYQKNTVWQKSQVLRRPNQTFDFFGAGKDLTMNDSFIFEGHSVNNLDSNESNFLSRSGAVFIYKNNNGNYQYFQKITPKKRATTQFFGFKVAAEGNFLLVGAAFEHYDNEEKDSLYGAGALYLYEFKGCNWEEVGKITPNDRISRHGFAWSLDFSNNQIVAGSNDGRDSTGQNIINNAGAVYFFEFKPDTNSLIDTLYVCDTLISPSGRNKWYHTGLYLDAIKDSKGCDSSILIQVMQMKVPKPTASATPSQQCLNRNKVQFWDSSSAGNSTNNYWLLPNGDLKTEDSFENSFGTSGKKTIWRYRSNQYCADSTSIAITILDTPQASVSILDSDTQCLDSNLFTFKPNINGGTEPYSYIWDIDGKTSFMKEAQSSFKGSGKFLFQMIVSDSNGCSDTIANAVWVEDCPLPEPFSIKTYNTFTPNGDGYNDVFDLPIENEILYQIEIYNRNGLIIFQSKNSAIDWNGKLNNTGTDLTEGNYYYKLDYQKSDKKVETVYGVVTLLR